MDVPYEISRLIAARILGTALTDDENRRLDEWLQASPEHQETFKRVQNLETVARLLELEQADYGKKWLHASNRPFAYRNFVLLFSSCLYKYWHCRLLPYRVIRYEDLYHAFRNRDAAHGFALCHYTG